MIIFESITMRNFLSYGNNTTVVLLNRPATTTLIVGEDLDNTADGKGANGVGKTAIFNALCYGVYDTPISNISKDNLVNNINKKNMEVIVEFSMPDGDRYVIKRARKAKAGAAGNTVHLSKNGIDITPDSANATNALIQKIIGIPYELFIRIVVFTAAQTAFLDLKTTDQANMIEELFGLTMLSQKAAALKDMIRETEVRIEVAQAHIIEQERECSQYMQRLVSAKGRMEDWRRDHERELLNAEQKVLQWSGSTDQKIEALQRNVHAWEVRHTGDLATITKRLEQLSHVDFDGEQLLHDTLAQTNATRALTVVRKKELEKEKTDLVGMIRYNEIELEHLRDAKCPRCLQSMPDAASEIGKCEQHSTNWLHDLETKTTQVAEITQSIEKLDTQICSIRVDLQVQTVSELAQMKKEQSLLQQRLEVVKRETNPYVGQQIDSINPYVELLEKVQNDTNPHIAAHAELVDMRPDAPDYTEINKDKKLVEHQQFLLKLLTKKDSFVRKALLNRSIPYLNRQLQHYLSLLGLPHKVEFTHEMTARISQMGRELDFGNLSAGQAARVNFALALAFRDVLQGRHAKINVCMFDEVLDHGLDTVGVQASARLLKRKARDEGLSLYITSHRDEIDRAFDHMMTVQLSKGFSYIQET